MTEAKRVYENIPCTFCGCLCDDIIIEVSENRIVKNTNGCAISKERFLGHAENRSLQPTIEDKRVTLKEALERAADIISSSKRLLIYGLSSTENDAQREAYKLAELAKGVVDNTTSVCHGPTILGAQESGEAAASLAEVRHRSDLVIYWGANPAAAHPRHIPHYIRQPGEYVTDPKEGRKIWLVDIRATTTARMVDKFIMIKPGTDFEVLLALRALIRGIRLDVSEVGGIGIVELEKMAETMKSAKYGVLFFGLGLTQSRGRHRNIDAAIRLIQDLNSHTKWTMMPMRGHYNVSGANKTSTWVTGYPYAVDFARGYPRFQPGEYTAVDMLAKGEADALLNIAADPVAHFPRDAVQHLLKIPVINIDPKVNMTGKVATVNIPAAIAGIECDGAATRMDGLPLYLRKVIDPPKGVIPDREILRMIHDSLKRRMKK
ncbi:MAG: formylmethanofuran dehydrogenase subunit B [Candidatus Thorarchaeota archaeon]|nr:formylmethanofuran dehydrogenase subunit B [Candidatus Thorarchaeota archaeon]